MFIYLIYIFVLNHEIIRTQHSSLTYDSKRENFRTFRNAPECT